MHIPTFTDPGFRTAAATGILAKTVSTFGKVIHAHGFAMAVTIADLLLFKKEMPCAESAFFFDLCTTGYQTVRRDDHQAALCRTTKKQTWG